MIKLVNFSLIFFVFLFLFVGFFHKVTAITQDLGRHLITGQIILETYQIPKINLFSYTYPEFPFINHHWLSEVVFYLIFKLSNYNGLLILTTLTIILAFSLIFSFSFKKEVLISTSLVSILYLRILFERTDIRPEIFSFLFLSIFLIILYSYQKKFTWKILWLIPIELLWVNTHIYFFIGEIVFGLFLITELFSKRKDISLWIKRKKPLSLNIIILTVSFILVCLITLINPNGISGATYPLQVFQNYGYSIEENQNVFFLWQYFNKETAPYFFAAIVLLFLNLIISFKKISLIDLLLSIFFTILGIIAVRNFPLFVFGTFIPLIKSLDINLKKIKNKPIFFKNRIFIRNVSYCLFFLIIIWQIFQTSQSRKMGFGVEKGAKQAANFFITNKLNGPIFNNFDIGSYLDYRFFGREKVFVDGRPEAYPSLFFKTVYIPMQENENIFEEISKKYNFNTIFFSINDQTPWAINFLKQITKNNDWKIIYLDDFIIILSKDNDLNKGLIEKYSLNQDSFNLESLKLKDLEAFYRLAIFFNQIGWINQEIKVYQGILNLNPNSCFALYNLSVLLDKQHSSLLNIYLNRFNLNCR